MELLLTLTLHNLVEYDDGDHEWMIMREEQDRIQIWKEEDKEEGDDDTRADDEFDTGGHWLEFKYCRPQDPAKMWQEFTDEATGTPFYYNSLTGETSWERPHGSEIANGSDGVSGSAQFSEAANYGPWSAHVDEATGKTFWHNDDTGESKWENPTQVQGTSGTEYANAQVGIYAQREVEFQQKVDEYGEVYYENPATKERDYCEYNRLFNLLNEVDRET